MSAQRPLSAPLRTPRRNQPDLIRTGAGPVAASMTPPGDPVVAGTGPGGGAPQQPVAARPRRGRRVLRAAVPAVLIAAAFGFALPHIASYRSVWTSIQAMTWPWALLVGTVAAASMVAYWVTILAVLPSIRLRQAAAVSLGSNAVANTLPAGGALAMGVSWGMLCSWGLSTADYVLYTLVTGIWNVFGLLGLPAVALLVLATASRPDAALITAAAVGLTVLTVLVCGLGLLLHSQAFALRAGQVLQPTLAIASRLARRPAPANIAGSLSGFRDRAGGLLAARGGRITAATAASHLTLWLVLLACLRAIGVSQSQVPWQTCLAAFAFIRLLTALPITPGGLGITELGLVGSLAAGAGHTVSVKVTAAVLLYRAVTYLPPIPLGALACLTWRYAPALISTGSRTPSQWARTAMTAPASPQRTTPAEEAATHPALVLGVGVPERPAGGGD
jgi:putative heme transporter